MHSFQSDHHVDLVIEQEGNLVRPAFPHLYARKFLRDTLPKDTGTIPNEIRFWVAQFEDQAVQRELRNVEILHVETFSAALIGLSLLSLAGFDNKSLEFEVA